MINDLRGVRLIDFRAAVRKIIVLNKFKMSPKHETHM